jgi:hypothetical protein
MANGRRKRVKSAIRKIASLAKTGVLGQYANRPNGFRKLSTAGLQAAKGQAPLAKTNEAIRKELQRRSTAGKYR